MATETPPLHVPLAVRCVFCKSSSCRVRTDQQQQQASARVSARKRHWNLCTVFHPDRSKKDRTLPSPLLAMHPIHAFLIMSYHGESAGRTYISLRDSTTWLPRATLRRDLSSAPARPRCRRRLSAAPLHDTSASNLAGRQRPGQNGPRATAISLPGRHNGARRHRAARRECEARSACRPTPAEDFHHDLARVTGWEELVDEGLDLVRWLKRLSVDCRLVANLPSDGKHMRWHGRAAGCSGADCIWRFGTVATD